MAMLNILAELHPSRWTFIWNALTAFSLQLCSAVLILVLGWWIARRVSRWLGRTLTRQSHVDATLRPILCDASLLGIRIVAIVGALSELGIQTASIVAVLGAAGLAIGLALQGTMQNIAAGIMLLLLRPFKVGDFIDGGAGNIAGTVVEVSLFTTRLTKPDGICEICAEQYAVDQFNPQLQSQSDTPSRPRNRSFRARRCGSRAGCAALPRGRRSARAQGSRTAGDGQPLRRQYGRAEHPCVGEHRCVLGHALESRAPGSPGAERRPLLVAAAHPRVAHRAEHTCRSAGIRGTVTA